MSPRPPRHWEHPPNAPTPIDFLTFDVAMPQVSWLATLNQHPRDHRLTFVSDTHRYFIDGAPTLGSVTGLIHSVCEEFNAEAVMDRMIAGCNWPRPGYLKNPVTLQTLARLREIDQAQPLVLLLEQTPMQEHKFVHWRNGCQDYRLQFANW